MDTNVNNKHMKPLSYLEVQKIIIGKTKNREEVPTLELVKVPTLEVVN